MQMNDLIILFMVALIVLTVWMQIEVLFVIWYNDTTCLPLTNGVNDVVLSNNKLTSSNELIY